MNTFSEELAVSLLGLEERIFTRSMEFIFPLPWSLKWHVPPKRWYVHVKRR